MNRTRGTRILALVVIFPLLVTAGLVSAQTSASYNLEWHVIGGGGQPLTSASFAVHSTAGQGAASPPLSTGSSYAVSGGYWFGSDLFSIYLPLVMRKSL